MTRQALHGLALPFAAALLVACSKPTPTTDVSSSAAVDAASPPKPLTWCQKRSPAPGFCEDFDTESGFDLSRVLITQGTAKLVASERSLPKALTLATSISDAGEGGSRASLRGNFRLPHAVGDVTFTFALRVGTLEATRTSPLEICDLSVGSYEVRVLLEGAGASVTEDVMGTTQEKSTPLTRGPAKGAWGRVTLHLVPAGSLQITLDDDKVLDVKPLVGSPNVPVVDFSFGARQNITPSVNELVFDDVAVDAK